MTDAIKESQPVAWRWLSTSTFRAKLPKTANKGDWQPLYTHPHPLQPVSDIGQLQSALDRVAVLADSKHAYFASGGGMSQVDRLGLEAELANLRMRRAEARAKATSQKLETRRTQLAILTDQLQGMGLGHLVEAARIEAAAQQEQVNQERRPVCRA